MTTLVKGDAALWSHVPDGGGYGYAGPRVTLLTTPARGRVKIQAATKAGETVEVSVNVTSLTKIEG